MNITLISGKEDVVGLLILLEGEECLLLSGSDIEFCQLSASRSMEIQFSLVSRKQERRSVSQIPWFRKQHLSAASIQLHGHNL